MKINDIYPELKFPFCVSDIEWRLIMDTPGRDGNQIGLAAAYVKARAIQERLDAVVGPDRWQSDPSIAPVQSNKLLVAVTCKIGIFDDEMGWVWKGDGAGGTNQDTIKGGFSAALKRTASLWSIGRYLYYLPEFWTTCVEKRNDKYVLSRNADVKELNAKYNAAMTVYMREKGYSAEDIRLVTGQKPNTPKTPAPKPKATDEQPQHTAPAQTKQRPASVYEVTGVRIRNGITMLQLQNGTKEPRTVFLNGKSTLKQGAQITNIKVTKAKENGSDFIFLENYDIAA